MLESRPVMISAKATPTSLGRYEIQLALGEGPIGQVFLAHDPRLGRDVAIKTLRLDLPAPLRLQLGGQIVQAARLAAALGHPALVTVHDIGDDPEWGPFVIFELVKGQTLRERLAQGTLAPAEVGRIARTLGAALTFAHARGAIHGNIKPENVLLTPFGPKLTDLGFRGPVRESPTTAPEVTTSGTVTARSDEYALAATLREALGVGELPVGGASVHVVLDCAMAADPSRRFPSCEAFGGALADALEGAFAPIRTPPLSTSSLLPRMSRRSQNIIAGAAALVIVVLLMAGRRGTSPRDEGPRRLPPAAPPLEGVSLQAVARDFAETFDKPHAPTEKPHAKARP